MPFELSDDEQLLAKVVAEFARDQITLETAHELDRHDRFPAEPIEAAAGLGLLGLGLPEGEGGPGGGPTAYALAVEALATVCPNTAAVVATHCGLGLRLLRHAQDDVRDGLLQAAVGGALVATLATEEAYGSDKSRLGTTATRDGDGFVLEGQKSWGVAAEAAGHYLVLAEVPGEGPAWFHVPAGTEGLTIGRSEALMGLRAAGIRMVYLSRVRLGAQALVGDVGEGLALYEAVRPWHQVGTAAALVGAVAGAYDAARRFAEDRVQFGKPIGTFQAVSDAVTDIDAGLAAARALTLQAAAALEGPEAAVWAARAKMVAAQAAVPLTRRALRVQGGTGFMREGGTERFARDVRALQFMGEPMAVQRDVLKRAVLDVGFAPGP